MSENQLEKHQDPDWDGTSPVAVALSNKNIPNHTYAAELQKTKENNNRAIKTLILEQGRVDILTDYILGYKAQQVHHEMMQWQSTHQEGMILAWRGSAKTTNCNVAKCLIELVRNPNIRICIASNGVDQTKKILREIKSHLSSNERFIELFGDLSKGAKVWTETEITINTRTSHAGEPTIYCTGMGTALPSRHFDLIIVDDLVTKDNSQTEALRKKTRDYFYQTLYPTLESPDGELWVLGTRWHSQDLYGWMQDNDYKESTLVIGVLDENTDKSKWASKYPTERMHKMRRANLDAFNFQYMCKADISGVGIFSADHFKYYADLPNNVFFWQGVDLAIGQKARHDHTAHVTVAIDRTTKDLYIVEYRLTKLTFPQQIEFLASQFQKYPQTIRVVIESNAFQIAVRQQMKVSYPEIPVLGHFTIKDKEARAQQLAMYFTDQPLRVPKHLHKFIQILRGFPSTKGSRDLMDALEIAVSKALRGSKKKRRKEPRLF